MIKYKKPEREYTIDEMIDFAKNPKYKGHKRSLAELDDVIDEIIERNPEFVEKINKIIEEKRTKMSYKPEKTQSIGSK